MGILALGDPCLEKGLAEQLCGQLGLRVDIRFYWLNRFTKAQTLPMTVVLLMTIVFGLCTVLMPAAIKERFDQVSHIGGLKCFV